MKSLMFTEGFKCRKVLVTGHTGFKGSWLTLWLSKLGAEITGLALDPKTRNDAYHAMKISSLCRDLRLDISNYSLLSEVFAESAPEIVFHLAAQPIVLESYSDPLYTFRTNIIGTANVLEACRRTPSVKAIVVVTSDKCYENREKQGGYSEDDHLGGKDPYSASKACAEIVSHSYRQSFFEGNGNCCSLATARAGNVIGGGDWSDFRIVPDAIRALCGNKPVIIRNPAAVRPWQHVLEPLGGYLKLASKLLENPRYFTEAWNFGPADTGLRTVDELVRAIISHWGKGEMQVLKNEKNPAETMLLSLNIKKSQEKLNWNPALSFDETVAMTVEWYRTYQSGADMQKFSIEQIEKYEKLIL